MGMPGVDRSQHLLIGGANTVASPKESYLIPLTHGLNAIVDPEDFERISAHKWQAQWNANNRSYYAKRSSIKVEGKRRKIAMAREVMGLEFGDLRQVDHENHDTLDNRKSNLRVATRLQNASNRRKNLNNKSGYKGVHFNRAQQKWQAYIRVNTKLMHLGFFEKPEDAYAAYCATAERLHGAFANLG